MSDKRLNRRKEPPTEDEWSHIFEGVDHAHKLWGMLGPLHSLFVHWKYLVGFLGFILVANAPQIREALLVIMGALP